MMDLDNDMILAAAYELGKECRNRGDVKLIMAALAAFNSGAGIETDFVNGRQEFKHMLAADEGC